MCNKVCQAFEWQYRGKLSKFFKRWKKQNQLGQMQSHRDNQTELKRVMIKQVINDYLRKKAAQKSDAFALWRRISKRTQGSKVDKKSKICRLV